MLGDGWYRGNLGFFGQRNLYGRRLALRAQLEIRYEDGRIERVVSDADWKTTVGPVLASDIYGGGKDHAPRGANGRGGGAAAGPPGAGGGAGGPPPAPVRW